MSRQHHKHHGNKAQQNVTYRGRQCQHAFQGCCRACSLNVKFIQRFETEVRRDGARQYQGVPPIAV